MMAVMVADREIRHSGFSVQAPSRYAPGGMAASLLDRKAPSTPKEALWCPGNCLFKTQELWQLVQHYSGACSVPCSPGIRPCQASHGPSERTKSYECEN